MYEGPAVALMPHGPEGTMIRLSLLWDFMHFVALGPQKKRRDNVRLVRPPMCPPPQRG